MSYPTISDEPKKLAVSGARNGKECGLRNGDPCIIDENGTLIAMLHLRDGLNRYDAVGEAVKRGREIVRRFNGEADELPRDS